MRSSLRPVRPVHGYPLCLGFLGRDPTHGSRSRRFIGTFRTGLRSCIEKIARCTPNGYAYFADSQPFPSSTHYDDSESDLYDEKFFHYHRKAVEASLLNLSSPLGEKAIDLLSFLKTIMEQCIWKRMSSYLKY